MSDEHRSKIRNSCILNALVEHVEGKREMSATQVTAGLGLLRKVMPDLASVEMDVEGSMQYVISSSPMTEDEWIGQYGGQRSPQ